MPLNFNILRPNLCLLLVLKLFRERKFILGNAKGEVAVYNFRNGAKMKDLDTQAGPIAGLVYCAREKAVLVACQASTRRFIGSPPRLLYGPQLSVS